MAQPALSLFKLRGVAIKIETTPGTDAVPVVGTNGVNLFDGSSGTEYDKIERNIDRPFFGGQPFAVGNERGFIEGDFELYPPLTPGGASTSSSDVEVLLLPAGFTVVKDAVAKTTRYNPVSSGIKTASAYWWQSGTKKIILGARNNLTALAMTIGDRFKGHVRLEGTYAPSQEALPVITTPDTIPTVIRSDNTVTTLTAVDGTPATLVMWAKSLSIDLGNTQATAEYTSHKEYNISDRQPVFTLRIAKTDYTDFNPFALRTAGSIIEFNLRQTETNGLYSELGVRGQIDSINEADMGDGNYGWEIAGPCVPSSAGGDELYIEFGDSTP